MDDVRLTPREAEIVDAIGEGLSYKAIAQRLGITDGSVGAYVHRIAQRIPGQGSPMWKIMRLWHRRASQPAAAN